MSGMGIPSPQGARAQASEVFQPTPLEQWDGFVWVFPHKCKGTAQCGVPCA